MDRFSSVAGARVVIGTLALRSNHCSSPTESEGFLRNNVVTSNSAEEQKNTPLDVLAGQLARVRKGDFNFVVRPPANNSRADELVELVNIVLGEVRRVSDQTWQAQRRLAAAVSHELKNPLGVIRSTSQTLSMLENKIQEKRKFAREAEHINSVIATLCSSIQEASERMAEVIARMERFTNLGGAVVQQVDVNEILSDVIAMAAPQLEGKLEIQLDLRPLRPLTCRPFQLTAAFASLVDNAIEAVDSKGRVAVHSRERGESIEIQIEDNGSGMSAEQLTSIFEPSFQIVKGRVAAGNWSLFSARRVIHEHDGEVRVDSVKGQGTTVTVVLPLENSVDIERDPQRAAGELAGTFSPPTNGLAGEQSS